MTQATPAAATPATATTGPTAPAKPGEATEALRAMMVDRQLRSYDVTDLPVLERFLETPRELFLAPELATLAYSDRAIPAKGASGPLSRAIPAPLVLARFLQGAEIRPEHKVLDVGCGAGYSTALLSGLAGQVVALESDAELAALARANLAKIGATATVECGPIEKGAPNAAPFDVILVHGAVEDGLDALFDQLAPNGRLLAYKKHGRNSGMKVVRFERSEGKPAGERALFDAAAPLLAPFAKAPEFAL